jgi:hypothetical protein
MSALSGQRGLKWQPGGGLRALAISQRALAETSRPARSLK